MFFFLAAGFGFVSNFTVPLSGTIFFMLSYKGAQAMREKNGYTVYILECGDNTLYTGITNHLQQRINQHHQGKGAKYTRGRGPFKLVWTEEHPDRASASRREREIKALSRKDKRQLIAAGQQERNRNGETEELYR